MAVFGAVAAPAAVASPATDQAREKSKKAKTAYDLGRYDEAAGLYEQAYEAVPEPSLLYNIGQSYRLAGKPDKALTAYRSYLRVTPASAPGRDKVEQRVVELEKAVADAHQSQVAPPPPVETPPPPPVETAVSQPAPVAAEGNLRETFRWFAGGTLDAGSLRADCSSCGNSFAAGGGSLHVGYLLHPRWALVLDSWGLWHHEGLLTVYQVITVVAGQYWLTPRWWLRAGAGLATAGYDWAGIYSSRTDRQEQKAGYMLGVGFEFYRRGALVLDGQARFGSGFYSEKVADSYVVKADSFALAIGASWYFGKR